MYQADVRLRTDELSKASGFHRELIVELERAGILEACGRDNRGEPVFKADAVSRCRLVDRLHRSEHMSFYFIRRWMDTLDRLEKAERELAEYRSGKRN